MSKMGEWLNSEREVDFRVIASFLCSLRSATDATRLDGQVYVGKTVELVWEIQILSSGIAVFIYNILIENKQTNNKKKQKKKKTKHPLI